MKIGMLHWSRPILVVLVTAIMLGGTWQRCPDPITDFGREIYTPWRITEGDVLYRDLSYFNGPLAPYFNAMIFEVFGVSLRTLKITNAIMTVLVALLVYGLIRAISDCLTGVVAGIAFATIFASGQLIGAASFNFLTPYSHDLTHGLAMSLAMLMCIWKASERHELRWFALAGVLFGVMLLTKAEVAFAGFVGASTALLVILISHSTPAPRRVRILLAFGMPALVAPSLAVLLLWLAMPLSRAVIACAGAWLWIGDERVSAMPFYRWVLGTDHLELNLRKMVMWLGIYAMVFGPGIVAGILLRGSRAARWRMILSIALALMIAGALVWWWRAIPWEGVIRPLPIVLILVATILVMQVAGGATTAPARVLAISLTMFSLALLAKIFFNVHLFHYGFALALPGTMILIAALVCWVPRWVTRMKGIGLLPQTVALMVLAVVMAVHVYTSGRWLAQRTYPVGAGPDRFLTDSRGIVIGRAFEVLREQIHPGDTLVVMPEGIMLNYLLRVPSSVSYQNFLPFELSMYGESEMLSALRTRPPTFIAVVHRDATEYDARRFGLDYAHAIERWIAGEYELLALEGAMPFDRDEFGILLMKRRATR